MLEILNFKNKIKNISEVLGQFCDEDSGSCFKLSTLARSVLSFQCSCNAG